MSLGSSLVRHFSSAAVPGARPRRLLPPSPSLRVCLPIPACFPGPAISCRGAVWPMSAPESRLYRRPVSGSAGRRIWRSWGDEPGAAGTVTRPGWTAVTPAAEAGAQMAVTRGLERGGAAFGDYFPARGGGGFISLNKKKKNKDNVRCFSISNQHLVTTGGHRLRDAAEATARLGMLKKPGPPLVWCRGQRHKERLPAMCTVPIHRAAQT